MKPVSDSKILFWLSLGAITPRKLADLISKFDSLSTLWNDFTADGRIREFLGEKAFSKLLRFHSNEFLDLCLDKLRAEGINVITAINPLFPKLLLQPEVNAPLVLYYQGDINVFKTECVAVVGTRSCSAYGKIMAKTVAGELAENGVTVVSGLATGIDAYAHAAAIEAKGKTIAVMAGGLNKITPVSNIKLYERILQEGGLVISEHTPNAEATRYSFPERNRIISGLSRGVAVIEAGEKSGALITAKYALENDRDVFAVPRNITDTNSLGTNKIIQQGAKLINGAADIISEYPYAEKVIPKKVKSEPIQKTVDDSKYSKLNEFEKQIIDILKKSDMQIDELSRELKRNVSEINTKLIMLEVKGLVKKLPGSKYQLKL